MTKQEEIEEMRREIYYARSKVNGIATSNDIAERLYSAGYRKVLLDTENGSCVDCIQYAPWQLVERKIEELKSENKQLKTECALLDDELRVARQDTIDALNKLKEKIFHCLGIENIQQASGLSLLGSLVPYDIVIDNIDELLEEYKND